MYESPINLIFQDIETQMVQEEEQMILNAIRKCDVVVDKNELIKAIEYDRNQYSKGYKDGVKDVLDKIRAEIDSYGSIWVEYTIPGNTHRDIENIVENVLKQAKEQVLDIIDKHKAESEDKG